MEPKEQYTSLPNLEFGQDREFWCDIMTCMFKGLINLVVTSFLFFPQEEFFQLPKDLGLQAENVQCVTGDGVKLFGWFLPAKEAHPAGQNPKTTILLLHGNASNISTRLSKAAGWVKRGVSVFLIDYRGYGKSEGVITKESDLYADADAAIQWLKTKKGLSASEIILYGESLGSAPAIELATREKFKGLILEAPLTSLEELRKAHYPWVPSFFLQDFKMDNLQKIGKALAPVFIMHGSEDQVCPYPMGRALYEKAREPKDFLTIQGGNHTDLIDIGGQEYFDRPYQFLGVHAVGGREK